jgi:hypothetical protein
VRRIIPAILLAVLICVSGSAAAVGALSTVSTSTSADAVTIARSIKLGTSPGETAEAPNGDFYLSVGTNLEVVRGNANPVHFAAAAALPIGLFATTSTLYVVTPSALQAFSTSSGALERTVALPGDIVTPESPSPNRAGLGLARGELWIWTQYALDVAGTPTDRSYG